MSNSIDNDAVNVMENFCPLESKWMLLLAEIAVE